MSQGANTFEELNWDDERLEHIADVSTGSTQGTV
jgi:hypothetical protein